MAVETVRESKVVHHNDHATVVIVDGEVRVARVKWPEKDGHRAQDMEFMSVEDLGEFLQNVIDVYSAACDTLGWTEGLGLKL